jgi:hypothetical protein
MDPRGVTKIQNPQKKGHCLPDKDSHGLVLPTYSRLLCCGGVSSGKSMTAACVAVFASSGRRSEFHKFLFYLY